MSAPAGYRIDDSIATLRAVLDPDVPTKAFPELSEDQRVELVIANLQRRSDDFTIAMIGPGLINKARAIAEVKARSPIGRAILEIEQHFLMRVTRVSA